MPRLSVLLALLTSLVLVGCSLTPSQTKREPEVVATPETADKESPGADTMTPAEPADTEKEPGGESQPSARPEMALQLSPAQLEWVGGQIYLNECSGQFRCLVHWNEGEAFPSLGIGHFIWYPEGVDGPFVESFPALVDYLQGRDIEVPVWLEELEPMAAPWPDRAAFLQVEGSGRVQSLRNFLAQTKGEQARFIFQRAQNSLHDVVEAAPADERARVRRHLQALTATPGGTYAVIDYVNFKGEGLAVTERYQDEGWGLLQVLLAMEPKADQSALAAFREAAGRVLTRRAENAEDPIERERWLRGWLVRLQTYREPPQGPLL